MAKPFKVGDRVSTLSLNKNIKDSVLTGVVAMIHSNGWHTVRLDCPYTQSSVIRRAHELLLEPVEPTDEELAAIARAGRTAMFELEKRGFVLSNAYGKITLRSVANDFKIARPEVTEVVVKTPRTEL